MAVHRVGRARHQPQPLGHQPLHRWLQRRHRGRGRSRPRAGGDRRRRRRLDPDPVGLLRAVRAQAAARPGHQRADGRPVVGARHRRAADPLGDGQRAGLRRRPRVDAGRPVPRSRAAHLVRRGGRVRAGPAPDRLVHQARHAGRAAPTPSTSRRSSTWPPTLEGLGHHVEEVDPHYPDPTAAFVPQFFAGVRTRGRPRRAARAARAPHPRDRPPRRVGAARRRRVGDAAGREGRGQGQPGLRAARPAAHPDHRPPAPGGRRARRCRHGPGGAEGRCR